MSRLATYRIEIQGSSIAKSDNETRHVLGGTLGNPFCNPAYQHTAPRLSTGQVAQLISTINFLINIINCQRRLYICVA